MQKDCFDFAYSDGAWTWSHAVGDEVVRVATRTFSTLYDCVLDARGAGFNASSAAASANALDEAA